MTNNTEPLTDAAFNGAREQYNSVIERLNAGDIRDTCGKAWNAKRAATRAAALSHSEDPQNTNHISSRIRRAGRQKAGVERMPLFYSARAQFLHQQAC